MCFVKRSAIWQLGENVQASNLFGCMSTRHKFYHSVLRSRDLVPDLFIFVTQLVNHIKEFVCNGGKQGVTVQLLKCSVKRLGALLIRLQMRVLFTEYVATGSDKLFNRSIDGLLDITICTPHLLNVLAESRRLMGGYVSRSLVKRFLENIQFIGMLGQHSAYVGQQTVNLGTIGLWPATPRMGVASPRLR
jgi:hypothetical protein